MDSSNSNATDFLIRIPDPNITIYRIFPIWRLQQVLRLRRLTLVCPEMWDDPFEVMARRIALNYDIDGKLVQKIIGSDKPLPTILGQCWSATEESDALWRVYSRVSNHKTFERNIHPNEEGVRVRSTPAKLLRALATEIKDGISYVGAVHYMHERQLLERIANFAYRTGVNAYSEPQARVKLQLLKRNYFEHEAEIRALAVWPEDIKSEMRDIQIDPNDIFDQITFDPRLKGYDIQEREFSVRSLGYAGEIKPSPLYQGLLLNILPR
jgi:hypothetical protein